MTLWIILLVLLGLLILALLSFLRLGARLSEHGAVVWVSWLGLKFWLDTQAGAWSLSLLGWQMFQKPLSAPAKPKVAKPKAARKTKSEGFSIQGLFSERAEMAKILGYLQHLHLQRLELQATIATPDPALTGMAYGFTQALLPTVGRFWPTAQIQIGCDFLQDLPSGRLELALKIRTVHLAVLGWRGLVLMRRASKLRKQKRRPYGTQGSVDQHGRRNAASG